MMTSEYIKTVTESNFEYDVIAFSNQAPVVVDFWAEWCVPCKTLTPILENLAENGQGSFRLAKVNVDDNPNLALRYNVRSIPNVKAFRDGQLVAEFLGLQPEPKVKEFIRNLAPSQTDLLLEKGQSQLEALHWVEAENSFRQFLTKSREQPRGLLGLLKSLIMQGKLNEARQSSANFPASREYAQVELLRPLIEALAISTKIPGYDSEPLEAAYLNALQLISRGNLPAAMDGMIEILRQDKHYRNDEVRKIMLGLFEILGNNHQLTQQYRRELAMVLF